MIVIFCWKKPIFQCSGDNPDFPYVIVATPTGTAAANVNGQTMHSAFSFAYGNEHFSLSDKKRDKNRTIIQNLRAVIIDEVSMIKADQLYQLDLRLREVTQKPDKVFGNVAIFLFGDILQLRPCKGRYIFEEPVCQDYKIAFLTGTHWPKFKVIILEKNHRQNEDKDYADLLNRVKKGNQTNEDINLLNSRVRPVGHPDLKGAMYLSCTNIDVNIFNENGLKEINSELITIESINIHPTIKDFVPHVNSRGNIGTENNSTPFKRVLNLKRGARVMLTYNIDVIDCLANGARGEIVDFVRDKSGNVQKIMIKFDEVCQGEQKRINDKIYLAKYPECTAIERVMYQYTISKKTNQ